MCCGTKRLVEIACPPDCVYLTTAQRHPAAAVKRQQERDLGVLFTALGRITEPQLELFFWIHSAIARFEPDGTPLTDSDVAEAAGALAASLETASRGVIYEQRAASPTAERLRRHLDGLLTELRGRVGSRVDRDAMIVLRGIERAARHQVEGIGSGPVDYLTLVARVLQERPPDARQATSRIILP